MKRLLDVESCLKHSSEPLLVRFGGELSKPTLTKIMYLASKARKNIGQRFVFPDPGNKQRQIFGGTVAFKEYNFVSKMTT